MAKGRSLLVVFGQVSGDRTDLEAKYAERLLLRELPSDALQVECPAKDLPGRVKAASEEAGRRNLPAESRVLLLAHNNIVFSRGSLERLEAVVDRGAAAAGAFSPESPPAADPPDYHTLGGMERYATRTASLPNESVNPLAHPPLALLTTVEGLRSGQWANAAIRVAGAWVHDFSHYRGGRREEMVSLVPPGVRRVLDVGGGEGGFLDALKTRQPECETHLAELSPVSCGIASDRVDKVWQGDFISLPLPSGYDCITFLDVLEHTLEPERWLERAGQLLAPEGVVVLSIPNVGHWSVVVDLMEGRWDYAPAGIHCITHLRFFTRTGLMSLLEETGFEMVSIKAHRIELPTWFDVSSMQGSLALDMESLATHAYHVVARPRR